MTNGDGDGAWVRSTKCDTGSCLEVRVDGDRVLVRNSTDPDGPRLAVPRARWAAFVADLKGGGAVRAA